MKLLPLVPEPTETNDAGITAERESDGALGTLCANWKRGCNCVTSGAVKGRLTLCNECDESSKTESGLVPLVKGDTVQRGDVFIDNGQQYEMSRAGVVLGVLCLGRVIKKDNGGWHRPAKL